MEKFLQALLGKDWTTTAAGVVGAGLTVAFDMMSTGQFDIKIIGPAVGLAILGRLSSGEKKSEK